MARNEHAGNCYRCGLIVEAGTGHFEKRRHATGWRVQHGLHPGHGRVTCEDAKRTASPADMERAAQAINGMRTKAPECPYCGRTAKLLTSSAPLYRGRDYGPAWACEPCGAWVGCHPGTTTPLGRLANAELRRAKMAAHAAFDPLWQRKIKKDRVAKHTARHAGYAWLAAQLGIARDDCHIGMFDVATCARVVEVCRPYTSASAIPSPRRSQIETSYRKATP